MAPSRALTEALEKLNSDKIKARTEGLAALRTALESDAALARLDPDGKNKEWLPVLQALFSCVATEKSSAQKKTTKSAASSSAAAERRAGEAARTVRWLVERAADRFNRKTANLVLAHLANVSVQGNMLYTPAALDYAKAARTMLAHAPHAEHLKDEMWERLAQISWNAVLGDSLRQPLDEIDDDANAMDVDSEMSGAEDELPGSGAKRRRTDDRTSPPKRARTAASLEQIEFCSLLATLHNIPSAPLCMPTDEGEDPRADALLAKHARFLSTHAPDGSLHADHLAALSGTLSRVALNRSQQTCAFARKAWPRLLALWSGRNRALKSSLLPVIRSLYPFYATNEDCESGLVDLWGALETDKGADALGIDALRLRLGGREGPFATKTFRHGRGFGAAQASAWVALEMQTDCAAKLLVASEDVPPTPTSRTPRGHHATRRTDPLGGLLSGRPSTLLFFVERHWSIIPLPLRDKVRKTLLQSISSSAADNLGAGAGGEKAAWAFLSLAALANQERPCVDRRGGEDEKGMKEFWSTIWAHAIRRLPHPLLSRPAAHTAHVLLMHGFISPLTLRPSLLSLARDLPVQSPPAAGDSVCAFLCACVEAARGDVSLFRAGVSEAVLGWAADVEMLRTGGWTVSDVLSVLVHACGLKVLGADGKSGWWSEDGECGEDESLPECTIVELVRREARESAIRGFVLEAKIPPFAPISSVVVGQSALADGTKEEGRKGNGKGSETEDREMGPPGAKERKVSANMLKLLESLQSAHDASAHPPAPKARATLNVAVLALCFEAALALNRIHANERVLRTAAKLIHSHTPLLRSKKWSGEEIIEILGALEPLVQGWGDINGDGGDEDYGGWEVMRGPSVETGVGQETLRQLGVIGEKEKGDEGARTLQRIIWQSADLQDALTDVMTTMQRLFDQTLSRLAGHDGNTATNGFADDDGFGAIRAAPLASTASESQLHSGGATPHALLRITTAFVARGPVLQSTSGAASRERALTDALLRAGDAEFLHAFPAYITHVRTRTLALASDALDALIEKLGGILMQHIYGEHAPALCAAVALFHGTMHLWLTSGFDESTLLKVQELLHHLGGKLHEGHWRDWRVRDALGAFFARYIEADPMEEAWYKPADGEDEEMAEEQAPIPPFRLIMRLNRDADIRVRVRVSGPSAELLRLDTRYGIDGMTVYEDVKDNLTIHLPNHQHMLTRILALGNAIVVSGAIARGPYWHLLETCIFTSEFNAHMQALFEAVAARMGLGHHRLFEMYAGQIAWTLAVDYPDKQAEQDFLNIDPVVLGYKDQRAFAAASFRAFAPAYAFYADSTEQLASGRARFARHCSAFGLSVAEGVRAAFADIVASDAIFCVMNERADAEDRLRTIFDDWGGFTYDSARLQEVLDAVLVSILRRLRAEEHQAIIATSQTRFRGRSLPGLLSHMLRFRLAGNERVYHENLPSEKAEVVFDVLDSLNARLPANAITVAVSYHILQQLVADIYAQPLVNEQLRLTCALALWIGLYWRHFREPMLLRALSHAASLLLARADLARAAQGLLSFAWYLYLQGDSRPPNQVDTLLCDVLVRVCGIAEGYVSSGNEELGTALVDWLHEETSKLLKHSGTRPQALRALVAWPRELPPELEAELQKAQASDTESQALSLTGMLADPRIAANKFRIVRRLAVSPVEPDDEHFARLDFWRLKECIPPRGRLTTADIDAFATLVSARAGTIHGFGTLPLSPQVERHQPSRVQKTGPGGLPDASEIDKPERLVLEHLLCALDVADSRQVQAAYAVLRTAPATPIPDLKGWDREFASEWAYFAAAPRPAREAGPYELERLSELRALVQDFSSWVCTFASALCDAIAGGPGGRHAFFAQLPPVLREDPGLAEQVLPVLIHTLLRHDYGKGDARNHLSCFLSDVLAAPDTAVPILKVIVDVSLHMRNFYPPIKGKDMQANERWLDVDRMLLSRAALRCGAYTTALLFYELEFARDNDDERPKPDDAEVEDILFAIYSHVDEPDGFYGIHTRDLHRFLLRRFQHERQWDRAFMFHGAAFEAGSGAMAGVRDSLHAFGFDRLALNVSGGEGEGMSYTLGWRTEAWDLPDVAVDDDPDVGLYRALRAVHRASGSPPVEDALQDAMDRLRRLGDEDLVGIRQAVRGLLCASQVRAWCAPALQDDLARRELDSSRWTGFLDLGHGFDFETMENLVATRMSLLSAVRQRAQRAQIGDRPTAFTSGIAALEKQCLVRVSAAARDAGALQIALNAVVRAQRLDAFEKSSSVAQEFANVLWSKGEHKLAIEFLREIVSALPSKADSEAALLEQSVLRSRLGSWSSEACMEKPAVIWESYFQPAIDHLQSHVNLANNDVPSAAAAARIFHECAVFADRHYHALSRSPEIVRRKIYVDRKQQEVKELESQQRRAGLSPEDARDLSRAKKLLQADTEVFAQHVEAQQSFLYQAAALYARSLSHSSLFDDDAHVRLVSLWYSNFDNGELADKLGRALDDVPSHKFVFLSHQLTARLAKSEPPEPSASSSSRRKSRAMDSPAPTPSAPSQGVLQRLVLRMCEDHPFHTVYQLFPLRPTNSEALSEGRRTSGRIASQSQTPSQGVRAAAAGDIFARLHEGRAAQRVSDVQILCEASLTWAKEPIKKWAGSQRSSPLQVPTSISLPAIPQKIKVPISTVRTPIDPTGRYDRCVWLESYDTTFTVAGGVNLPKIHTCHGSDGQKYVQLFKGEGDDDIRQDAVMEQVFDLVNIALRRDRETKRRSLNVRTYCVLPLAEQAGILEFVQNTKPVDDVLRSLHRRYRPLDLNANDFSAKMKEKREKYGRAPVAELTRKMRELWNALKPRLRPVMRHWFTEEHKVPMSWFAMRLNYARSLATMSIVGHMLGLGDRHIKNILLDKSTGEAVNIDLGIAFDQGKLLPVPELVPFRLTEDMVDGLGTSGTQGVFQRCAEETLRVLRADREVVLTVLEVFKYDPLHSWVASDSRLTRAQEQPPATSAVTNHAVTMLGGVTLDMNSAGAEEAADRALSAVARKLDAALSVEHTVNELIHEASDPANLCMMYQGWSPYY